MLATSEQLVGRNRDRETWRIAGIELRSRGDLDPATGDERWKNRASAIGAFGPIGTDGHVIQVLFDGNRELGAYDVSTGKELWLISPPGGAQRFGGLPLAAADTLFVPTTNALIAMKK